MNLTVARKLFDTLRSSGRIAVKRHAYADYPKRRFTKQEVVWLAKGDGYLKENHVDNPAPGSFVWHCKDDQDHSCELCVQLREDDVGQLIMVISAFRRV